MPKAGENVAGSKAPASTAKRVRAEVIEDEVGGGCQGPGHVGVLLGITKSLVYILTKMGYPWGDFTEK